MMRTWWAVILLTPVAPSAYPYDSIRQVDFANFSYYWRDSDEYPGRLEWLDVARLDHVRLTNGRWILPEHDGPPGTNLPFAGLTLEEVAYGDLTGDRQEEAVVVIRFDSGGTQYHYYGFIYSLQAGSPKLIGSFRSGDRAHGGLYHVYIRGGRLVLELFDPDKEQGDCCSNGFLRSRYRWDGSGFRRNGPVEKGTPDSVTRRRVSVFGLPN